MLPALAGGLPASRGGGLASTTDGRGIATFYQYDGAGRLTGVACSGQSVTVTYDLAGRPLTVSGPNGIIEYAYDPVHKRLIGVTTTGSGPTYQVTYSYYPDGKVATMTSPVRTTSYAYDVAGRMVSLTDPFGALTTWTFDAAGRVTSETTLAGATTIATSYGYGPSGQPGDPSTAPAYLRSITQTVNGQPFQQYTLTHSYLGQLLQQVGTGAATENSQWSYDARGRLTASSIQYQSGGLNYAYTGAYQYDLANNLQGGTGGWTYNSNNQVTQAPPMGGLTGATGLGYDASGDLTSINGASLTYNAWGDMTADGTASYAYDGFGRRISKTVGGQTTYYRYDDGALIAEVDAQGAVLRSYTWGACGLIGGTSGGQAVHCLYDGMANKRYELNAAGSVAWRGAYSDFGEVAQTLPPALPMAYQGRYGVYTDSSSGMLWSGSRYYAPTIGRQVQPSGPGYVGGNPYAYTPPPQEDAPDAGILPDNWNGEQGGLYQAADVLKTGLLTAASFNPLSVLSGPICGQNAAGEKVGKLQRGFDILTLAAGPLLRPASGAVITGVRGGGARLAKLLAKAADRAQVHHILSSPIIRALKEHPVLKHDLDLGMLDRSAPRFVARARNIWCHFGWQRWHRRVDKEVADRLEQNGTKGLEAFLQKLRSIYDRPAMKYPFPGIKP